MQTKFCPVLRLVMVITWILIGVTPQVYTDAKIEAAQINRIPEDMRQKVRERGVLSVIVHLNFPWKPLADLSSAERIAQQQAIIAAQDQLLAELRGTQYMLIRRFTYSAALVLDVGPDALAVLGNSTLVKAVTEDIPVPPL